VTVKSYNGDCAVLTGLLHIEFSKSGKIHDFTDRFTDVWVKDGANWRYVQGQATLYKPS
jgi:ketosteroid isomerase-like protein